MKRTLVAVALAVVMIMALAAPALAQSMMHTATYEMDGTIDLEKQAGHLCNTGAEVKQTIKGNGVMSKVQTVNMEKGIITMDDANDWVAGATALTVTTVWELCAPPKYTWSAAEYVYSDATGSWYGINEDEGVVTPFDQYNYGVDEWGLRNQLYDFAGEDQALISAVAAAGSIAELRALAAAWGITRYGTWDTTPLTDQIWAVQVQADPGFSGNLSQSGEAAYGPYGGAVAGSYANWVDAVDWTTKGAAKDSDTWKFFGSDGVKVGPDYVGNYFTMDQHARTSQGTLKRYIDISSPWSHAYLMEDMSVVGKSDITEAFVMTNLPKGAEITGLWWDLF